VQGLSRYFRLLVSFARFSLTRDMAFRGNFLVKITVECLWLGILLAFYGTVFSKTSHVADWSEPQYMFFVGCYFALESLMESLFMSNCNELSELVRTGELDFYLLQPIDEQFLVSCRNVEWSSVPSVFLGLAIMGTSLWRLGWAFDPVRLLVFAGLFACGLMLAYSFMLLLSCASVWMIRNQSLYELWWLVMSLMRYPREIFARTWFEPVSIFFTFFVPVMLIINVPARTMVKVFEPHMALFTLLATMAALFSSRKFFRYALQKYRSASS
jgi:ABC-2 type transport system permease protein